MNQERPFVRANQGPGSAGCIERRHQARPAIYCASTYSVIHLNAIICGDVQSLFVLRVDSRAKLSFATAVYYVRKPVSSDSPSAVYLASPTVLHFGSLAYSPSLLSGTLHCLTRNSLSEPCSRR